jgi:hypothetical protein
MTTVSEQRPILESGDRLTRDEFHRRYSLRPDIRRAELVLGVVYVSSPVRTDGHGDPVGLVTFCLNTYTVDTPDLRVGTDGTVRLSADTEVQPDPRSRC